MPLRIDEEICVDNPLLQKQNWVKSIFTKFSKISERFVRLFWAQRDGHGIPIGIERASATPNCMVTLVNPFCNFRKYLGSF